jgi:hypothetical protein
VVCSPVAQGFKPVLESSYVAVNIFDNKTSYNKINNNYIIFF